MKFSFYLQVFFLLAVLFCCRCSLLYKPGSSLRDVEFNVYPSIVEKNGSYYLRYQIKVSNGELPLLRKVYSKTEKNKAYYFFSVPISHPEYGNLIERSLNDDGFTELAKKDAIYWLNKDGSEVKLKIVKE